MEANPICTGCQQPLPQNAPEGLCPACLAKVALDTEPTTEPAATLAIGPEAFARVRYFGDYELLEEIAHGGMGVVYKARQVSLNRIVAVKMILAGQLASEAEVKRFRTEAEAAAQLQHPNIVSIHEVGEHEGQQYFSMDFIVGASLAARIGKKPLAIGEAVQWMKTIAEAVHFAHQRGIVHRDLKPANVLLDEFDQPRITDFGLAKRLDRGDQVTASGALLGTPDYMSPEQVAGRHDISGPASDVFSLGAMLYEMLTGRVPFRGSNLADTLSHILQDEPERPSRLNSRVPADLETICLKCLEKRPDGRYPTAGGLATDLGRFLNHEAISARPVSASRQVSRWLMGHPQVLAAVGSGLLLALLWFGYGLWTENRILIWAREHPTELEPASEGSNLEWNPAVLPLLLLGVTAGLADLLARRRRARVLTGRFISPRILAAFGLAGLAGLCLSVYAGAQGIKSWRWAIYALPRARADLVQAVAADAKARELRGRSSKLATLTREEANLSREMADETKKLADKARQHSLAPGEFEAEMALLKQKQLKRDRLQTDVENTILTPTELAALLQATGLGSPAFKQFHVQQLDNRAGNGKLTICAALVSAWIAAGLSFKAIREQRFAFYFSAEEEQSARWQAALEVDREAQKERARRRGLGRVLVLISVLLLICPYLYWNGDDQVSWKALFLLGEASAVTLALTTTLQGWRGGSRRKTLSRVLLAVSAIIAVIVLLHGPGSLMGQGIAFGAGTGTVVGVYFHWAAKKNALCLPKADSANEQDSVTR